MTGEELDRAIEFLLQGQANYQVRLDELAAQIAATNRQIAETNRVVQHQGETLSEFIRIVTSSFGRMAAAEARADKKIAESRARTDQLIAENNARTDQRIFKTNAQIAEMFERHIREGHGNS